MSSDKRDLTRIEDLGEFIHELNAEDESDSLDLSSELPDLPSSDDEDVPSFDSPSEEFSEGLDFGTTEEFGSSTDFNSDSGDSFSTDFCSGEETDFSSSSFSSEEEDTSPQDSFSSSEEGSTWNTDVPLTEEMEKDDEPFTLSGPDTSFEPEEEPEIESIPEPALMREPEPRFEKEQEYKTPETFEDLKKFSESSSFSGMASEGNPSFSVLLKNVRYIEDVNDIVSLLRELNLLIDTEEQTKARLMRGMLLVPRISEYAAIFLAHKLRRFDIDIQLGLSDEIHPPKHQEAPETGIVSRHSLYQNQNHHFQFDDVKIEMSQIIVSATSTLEGYQVVKYLGVASEHKMLDSNVVEDENSSEVPSHYQELAQKLKAHALKSHSNAVVGLNYQLTPIPSEYGMGGHKYRLTCTGNLVWVNKL